MSNQPLVVWPMLVKLESKLGVLETWAMELARKDSTDWQAWESRIKSHLKRLVGDFAETDNELLGSREAWDVAHDHLLRCFEGAIR